MPVETGTTLNDLNAAWPPGTDGLNEADDHLRLIKQILQSAFGDNPAVLTFNGNNLVLDQDVIARALQLTQGAEIPGLISKNPQVAIAGGTFDGTDGSPYLGATTYGISQVQRISAGTYEIQLVDQSWATVWDLGIGQDVNFAVAGSGSMQVIPPDVNTGGGWIQVVTVLPDGLTRADGVFKITIHNWAAS